MANQSEREMSYFDYSRWQLIHTLDAADIISTVEFDHTGNYLATGDKGGRVVLFERNESVSSMTASLLSTNSRMNRRKPANTNSTPNFNHMSLNSTISNPWK